MPNKVVSRTTTPPKLAAASSPGTMGLSNHSPLQSATSPNNASPHNHSSVHTSSRERMMNHSTLDDDLSKLPPSLPPVP